LPSKPPFVVELPVHLKGWGSFISGNTRRGWRLATRSADARAFDVCARGRWNVTGMLLCRGAMKLFVALGALNAFLAVAAGAFGAHGLKARLTPELLAVFETGARYHLFHALGLIAVGLVAQVRPSTLVTASGWALLAGIVLFSGSLYVLASSGVRMLGAVTPFGGVAFLLGWALLAVGVWR
jgi:uncharacterized membrane protein YgdD (TMEM256/DUF423 family)